MFSHRYLVYKFPSSIITFPLLRFAQRMDYVSIIGKYVFSLVQILFVFINLIVEIIIYIGNNKAYVNGEEMALDSPAFIENDRTYCPVRFICEKLGASVEWNNDTREVVITK